jgi:hypothetical protein
MSQHIILLDLSVPLSARKRTFCGPYRWTPSKAGSGRTFYMECSQRGDLACASHGSTIDLRVELAEDHVGGRLSHITSFGGGILAEGYIPIVMRLPRSRGFLAGWTLGAGMVSSVEPEIYDDIEDAARAAYSIAENAAENEIEHKEAYDAGRELRNRMIEARETLAEGVARARAAAQACTQGAYEAARLLYVEAGQSAAKARAERDAVFEELHSLGGGRLNDAFREGYAEAY